MNDVATVWDECQEMLDDHADTLDALREYVQFHFLGAEGVRQAERPTDGYMRRPVLGLRIELAGGNTLAIRPGWQRPNKTTGEPGQIDASRIEVELLTPATKLELRLREGTPKAKACRLPVVGWRGHLRTLLDAAHDLLIDPMGLFSRQSDNCCCCGKLVTDVVSRTRGIGPECIRLFCAFQAAPPTAVEKYRQRYLASTGFLPGR